MEIGVIGGKPFSEAPSGRELPTKSGEGECASKNILFSNEKVYVTGTRAPSVTPYGRATSLPEGGFRSMPTHRQTQI